MNIKRFVRELTLWLLAFSLALPVSYVIVPERPEQAQAAVTNNGVLFYGDTDGAGIMRARVFTNPATWAAEIDGITGSASNILHTVAKTAPTREEMMIGSLRVNGELQIESCTTGCDATADYTARWNNPGTSVTQNCNTAGAGTCIRFFDIAYEQLSGRAMVVYADNVADKVYYARWDGSAWSPNATPGSPGVSNEINLPGAASTPQWIRVIARGDQLAETRSNQVMALIADGNNDLHAFYWDGAAWDAGTTLTTTLTTLRDGQAFDGGWETNNGRFIATWATTAAVGQHDYNTFTPGTGWGTPAIAFTAASAGQWVSCSSDPTSDRVMCSSSQSADDARADVWRNNGTTDGWTACAVTDCPDTTTEEVVGKQSFEAWERFSSQGMHVYNDAGTTTDTDYVAYDAGTFSAAATAGITTSDDSLSLKAWGSPNDDDIMVVDADVDCDTYARNWNGTAWDTAVADLELNNTMYGVACPGLTSPGANDPRGQAQNYDFAWKYYAAWQRNWRFYSGSDTASIPTVSLAGENRTPIGIASSTIVRLRIQYADRGGQNETDARKKLQYTSGCTPNSSLETTCTWTDVGESGSAALWRYNDVACTPTDCADNTLLTGTVLNGTDLSCTLGNGCGTWIESGTGAGGLNMDHNGLIVQESEYIIQNNGAAANTTYYFRLFDNGQDSPVYREQDSNDCGRGAAQCTYPSLVTNVTYTQRDYRWFANADGVQPGAALAAENTAATITSTSTLVRDRMNVTLGGAIPASSRDFKLQFATSTGGPWTDVADWWNSSWLRRKKITFDNGASTENLANFPVLVSLSSANIDYTLTQDAGQDIRFVDSDGVTQLAHQIENWNEAGTSTVWVKVPQIDTGSITDFIWIYYNNTGAADGQDAANVWDGNYVGVWHLREDPTSAQPAMKDSATNTDAANDGTAAGMEVGDQVAGQVNGSLEFNAAADTNDIVDVPDSAALEPANNITVEGWLRPINLDVWDAPIIKTTGTGWADGYGFVHVDTEADGTIRFWINSYTANFVQTTIANDGATWSHLVGTYDGSRIRLYVNGKEVGSLAYTASITANADTLSFGSDNQGVDFYNGRVDEVRFSNVTRSTSWIDAQYRSMKLTFNTFGSEESYALVAWRFRNNPTPADGAAITSLLLAASETLETYEEANTTAMNPNPIAASQEGEWDFALDPANAAFTTYFFRLVLPDGTALNTYTNYPQLIISSGETPTTDQLMRHGNWFNTSGVEQSFFWAQ